MNEMNVKFDISLIQITLMNRADIQHFVASFLFRESGVKTIRPLKWELKVI